MARKGGSRGGSTSGQKPKPTGGPSKSSARVKKMETYEDTLNEGGVDDCELAAAGMSDIETDLVFSHVQARPDHVQPPR